MKWLQWWGLVIIFLVLSAGYPETILRFLGVLVMSVLIMRQLKTAQKTPTPYLFFEYGLFLAVFLMSVSWSVDKVVALDYWVLYAAMAGVWLLAFRHRDWLKRHLFEVMLVVGVGLLVVTGLTQTWEVMARFSRTPRGLWGSYAGVDHFMVGDYWAVVLVMAIYRFLKTKSIWYLPLISVGVVTVFISLSRSALVGVAVAGLVMMYKLNSPRIWQHMFVAILATGVVFMGLHKSLFSARPYYFQALAGVVIHPLGVGVGNFSVISKDVRSHFLGMSGFSRVTHSILLEFLAGMGILVVVWWRWCKKVYDYYLAKVDTDEFSLGLMALAVDFLFNPTYLVTSMWGLFGMLLGVVGKRTEGSLGKKVIYVYLGFLLTLSLWVVWKNPWRV